MRRALAPLLGSLVFVACSAAPVTPDAAAPRLSRRATVAAVLKSSVRVQVMQGGELKRAASGVVVAVSQVDGKPVSMVVTNEHVVSAKELPGASYQVVVDAPGGAQSYEARLQGEGAVPALDLALLAVPGAALTPATFAADDEVSVGDEVVVVGAPFNHGLSLSHGMLSQVELGDGAPSELKTDAPVGYGASGGGVFSAETGHLVGVIEGYRTAQVQIPGETGTGGWSFDVPMPGETFASAVAKVRRFVAEKGSRVATR
jgi:S1-C subfamily serine protease